MKQITYFRLLIALLSVLQTSLSSAEVTGFTGQPYVWNDVGAKNAASYAGANGRAKIQAAINDRIGDSPHTVIVPAAGPDAAGVWALDQALILPSNTTLLLDGCKLFLNSGSNDNLIRNSNPFAGGNTNIKIVGRNGARLDGNAAGQSRTFWGERNDNSYHYFGIYLCDVDGFQILNLKIGPTQAWAIAPQASRNGLISDIEFAQNGSSANQDGVTSGRGIYNTTIRNLTGVTYDDTVDIASTNESKFAHSSIATDCYNILIENVTTSYGPHKCIKLVAGNGRAVRDIHVRNIRGLSSGFVLEIEGDWASVKPTIDEMKNITFENIEGGVGEGILVVTSNCQNVVVRGVTASPGYGRILDHRSGYRLVNFLMEDIVTQGAHQTSMGELFWFQGQNSLDVTLRNIRTEGAVKNLIRANGASITNLLVDNVLLHGMAGVMFQADTTSDIRGTASNINLVEPDVPGGVYVQNMPHLQLVNFLTDTPALVTNLAAVAAAPQEVTLSWNAVEGNTTGYVLQRRPTQGTWEAIATLPAGTTGFADTGVLPATSYQYRCRIVVPEGEAALWSAEAQVTTPSVDSQELTSLLHDTFADNERATQALPASAAWYFGSDGPTATASSTAGDLRLSQGTGTSRTMAVTSYFADSAGQPLAVGEALSVSFDVSFILNGTLSQTDGLRFGIYRSGGSRVLTDLATNNGENAAYGAWRGYAVFTTLGSSGAGTLNLRKRALGGTVPVATAQHALIGTGVPAPALGGGTTVVDNVLTLTRTASGLRIEGIVAGTRVEAFDSAPPDTAFDAISFWSHNTPLGGNGRVTLDNVRVTHGIPSSAPPAPTGFLGSPLDSHRISLSWDAPAQPVTGFRLERRIEGGSFEVAASPGAADTSAIDIDLLPGTAYTYRLFATTPVGDSQASDEISLVTDTLAESWRRLHFESTANSGDAADDADPDQDGLKNLLERALGTDPRVPGSSIEKMTISGNHPLAPGYLVLSIDRNPSASDLMYTVEIADTPGAWQSGHEFTTVLEDTPARLTVRDKLHMSEAVRRFMHLKVETAP